MKKPLIALFCILMWYETWAALFADVQAIGSISFANRNYREQLGVSCFFALLPPIWIGAPFMTGFYEHGWNWTFKRRTQ